MTDEVVEYFVQGQSPDRNEWCDVNIWDDTYKWNGYPNLDIAEEKMKELIASYKELGKKMRWNKFRIVKQVTKRKVVKTSE